MGVAAALFASGGGAAAFGFEQVHQYGVDWPVSGSLEYRPSVINERLNRDTQGNKACMAPEKHFRATGS